MLSRIFRASVAFDTPSFLQSEKWAKKLFSTLVHFLQYSIVRNVHPFGCLEIIINPIEIYIPINLNAIDTMF